MGSIATDKHCPPPHAVCVPFPAQGHINPMFKLAKILHQRGFHITLVNSEYNHNRLLKSRGPHSLRGLPTFRFDTIPDGLPLTDADSTQDVPSLCASTKKNCLPPFRDLLSRLNSNNPSSGVPPVTCIVSDCIMSFTLEAAQELGIPNVLFWTASASSILAYLHYRGLLEKGYVPLKDASYLTNGYLDTAIDWIPSLEGITLKYLPSFIRTTDPDELMVHFALGEVENARNAAAVIFNTFDELEHEALQVLHNIYPQIYTIGPLQLLQSRDRENGLDSIGSNLWKEQPGCLEWLDSREPGSVVYVNFGSVTVMTAQQLIEFAWGLANTKLSFLWVIRLDLVAGESAILPPEFVAETKERGLLSSWCPQEQVLEHPAVGGFLTHNGWNSTIESLSGGKPMICWPFFAEQQTNCWLGCNKWGVAMEIDNDVKRDEIEKIVRVLMEGEKGREMRNKAMEWRRKAEEATTANNGSSFLNLDKMITQVLLSQRQ
ncbi:hypothetical protein Tsubulata_035384 [Turnera subulata]|uniref:linamarin synthase n=1 Tax=Turnera subulata TaxID=218843 RepID=A0A9Q0GJ18_9ROSI|nr:hypothetical protein Tsubulata_035384 [Turnera subulata]